MHCFRRFSLIILLFCLLFSTACNPDDEMEPKVIDRFDSGVYVINQGDSNLNASVSYYLENCQQVANDIYAANNSMTLDGPLMDLAFTSDSKVLLLQSDKLIIANATTFEKLGEITGFTRGQQIEVITSAKAYITRYNDLGVGDGLLVADLNNMVISNSTHPNRAADEMHRLGVGLYVANSGGDLVDSTITKFDATSDLFLANIEVGKRPKQIVSDKNGDIWVLCEGVLVNFIDPESPDNTPGQLVKISNDQVVLSIPLGAGARNLTIDQNKETLYFVNKNWTYEFPITNTALALTPFIAQSFNGYKIDPSSNILYAANALDFAGPGKVWAFDLNTKDTINTFEVGNIPLDFEFR